MAVMLVTSVGELVIDLFTEQCPMATKNFLKLCKIKYYNNCLFHSVQKDFIAQTGDPTGTGKGGDSIYKLLYGDQARFFDDEIHPTLKHDKVGVVAMASAGENANASQFYITTRAELDYLDEKHTVFGEVGEGLDTLMRINEAFVDDKFRPYKNIRIKHAIILEDPFDDPAGLGDLIPDRSPELKPPAEGEEVRLEDDWVPMDETMDPEEIEKSLRKKEAQSRAVVLEMIGDLPEADMKPPENVLFVCKLNSVTEEGDLELIFGRFGKVKSADIIRDFKTGDSLCYAFIEFETEEACEAAYFKMDNVLIDDRRIHVDFSQSVSHLWNRYRKLGKTGGDGQSANQGKGCFKCGEVGHFAKECPNDGADQKEGPIEKPKYTIKDTGGQRGNANKRYDMVFDDDADEAPQEKKVADKHGSGRHKFARETEEEKRRGGQEDRDDRPEYYDRSRQGRRHDKDRGVHHREYRSGHHSRSEREFERPIADRDTNRRTEREFERSRVDRDTSTRTDREFDKPRAGRDTDRTREFDKAAVERDTDRRTERNFEKSRSDKDGSRRDERDVSRQVDRPARSPRATERVRPDSKSRREEEIPRENTRTRDTKFEEQRRDREKDSFRRQIDDSGGREKRSRRSGDRDVAQIESRAHGRENKSAEASRENYGEKSRRYRRSGREASKDIEDNGDPSGDLYDKAAKSAKDSYRRSTERDDIGRRERGNGSYHKDDTHSRRR